MKRLPKNIGIGSALDKNFNQEHRGLERSGQMGVYNPFVPVPVCVPVPEM
jgi:hypothetical protein